MDECREGAPTWHISGNKCGEIPVPKTDFNWCVDLSLYSSTSSFTPSIHFEDTKFVLGYLKDVLVVVPGGDVGPLAPLKQHALTFVLSFAKKITLEVGLTFNCNKSINKCNFMKYYNREFYRLNTTMSIIRVEIIHHLTGNGKWSN